MKPNNNLHKKFRIIEITALSFLLLAGNAGAIPAMTVSQTEIVDMTDLLTNSSPPNAATLTAVNITSTSAILMGLVNPNGLNTEIDFASGAPTGAANDWGISPTENIGNGTSPLKVSYTLNGLLPGITYFYAVRASNSLGWENGAVLSFKTLVTSKPTSITLDATSITSTGATLTGSVNPNGLATKVDFASADPSGSPSYFSPTTLQNIGSSTSPVDVSFDLTGLAPGTTYSYVVRATNSAGSQNGDIVTFTTPPAGGPLDVTTLEAIDITSTSAKLLGSVNPNGLDTEADFASGAPSGAANDWGISTLENIGNGTSPVEVSYLLTDLEPDTTYYYAVRATNSGGSQNGAVLSFTTLVTSKPTSITLDATDITSTGATLTGSVNPNGLATKVDFASADPSGSPSYFSPTTLQNIGSSTSPVDVSFDLTGLAPGTTYSYVVRATNSAGSQNGDIVTFTTPSTTGGSPTATTLAAVSITSTGATLIGLVNPNGLETEIDFASGAPSGAANDWGISPLEYIGSDTSPVEVSYDLTGLMPGTTYYYAVRATNNAGWQNGAVVSFTTPAGSLPPGVIRQWASSAFASSEYDLSSWAASQATGAPDTFDYGDFSTAWAPLDEDNGTQWIELSYSTTVFATGVNVYETFNPGTLYKIELKDTNGTYHTVWTGSDPNTGAPEYTITGTPGRTGWSNITFSQTTYPTNAVKLYLDTNLVHGWNEIDAVELVGIDAGTAPAPTPTITPMPTPVLTPAPTITSTPTASGGTIVSIEDSTAATNGSIIRPIIVKNVTNLGAATIWLTYDPNVVKVLNVSAGDLGAVTAKLDNINGKTSMTAFSTVPKSGDVTFANVVLKAVGQANATSPLTISVIALADSNGNLIPGNLRSGTFTVSAAMKGDVNGDSQVTVVDALFIAQYTVGLRTLSSTQIEGADVNCDGSVTVVDALFIAQYTVGLRTGFC